MIYNKKENDEVYIILKNEIDNVEGRFVLLKRLLSAVEGVSYDMPAFLQSPEGQNTFRDAVLKLVSEQYISPVGNKPDTPNGLNLKYRISKEPKKNDNELVMQIIKSIELPATVDYYIKHPHDFLDDKAIIDTISNFLKQKRIDLITLNERAYELFGDEKFFKGDDKNRSRGEVVLKRLGLDYSNLRCEETVEPFFSFYKKDFFSRKMRNIYIIENKDTFWSFKRSVMDSPSILKLDMLIYGEGKKIISSFRYIDEYDIDSENDTFFYFGDLDAEGVNIYCDLKRKYPQYNIFPFCEGYQAILEIGLKRKPARTPKQQKICKDNIDRFIESFDETCALKLKKLLDGGFYIPQEALSAVGIKERFGNIQNG